MSDILGTVVDILTAVCFITGALFAFIGALGLDRLADTRSRMHAATKPATLGVALCALGAALQLTSPSDVTKVVVIVVLQLVTAPIGAHMLGRSVDDK
ncbi:MAG: monovalent cation/H(+) antiporter subunit G [Ilumatobacteraceae bacterium]